MIKQTPYTWTLSSNGHLAWPVSSKTKPDLIIFDPPYFKKKEDGYDEKSISGLSKNKYLGFLEAFFVVAAQNAKKNTLILNISTFGLEPWWTGLGFFSLPS